MINQGSAKKGVISREDAAMICVKALEYPPKKSVVFEVSNFLPSQSVLRSLHKHIHSTWTYTHTLRERFTGCKWWRACGGLEGSI